MSTPFDLLELPATYALEEEQIHAALRLKSIIHHPDRFASSSEKEIESAEKSMAELNQAHAELSDPLKRAFALLAFHGHPSKSDETVKDANFLMEMFDVNERISEAQEHQEEEKISLIINELEAQEKSLIDELHLQFATWEKQNNDLDILSEIKKPLMRLQYITKLIEDNT